VVLLVAEGKWAIEEKRQENSDKCDRSEGGTKMLQHSGSGDRETDGKCKLAPEYWKCLKI